MRRTRHVVLPVKSWQYMGLLLVSLACLTLGHVSRDREGRAGSLAGPELKHTAPHEVDACPNANSEPSTEGSTNIRDSRSRIAADRFRESRQVRGTQENQRLIRIRNSRSERRSLGHRAPENRQIRQDVRVADPSRVLQRVSTDRVDRNSRDRRTVRESRVERSRSDQRSVDVDRQDKIRMNRLPERSSRNRVREANDVRGLRMNDRVLNLDRQKRSTPSIELRRSRSVRADDDARSDRLRTRGSSVERRETRGDRRSDERRSVQSDQRARFTRERLSRSNVGSERNYREASERQNSRSERVQESIRSRSHSNTRREVPWVETLRRSSTISRTSRGHDVQRRQTERLIRENRKLSRVDDNRDNDRTRADKKYLVPYLTNNKIDNQNYELLKQVFVLALCTIYTASILRKKNDIIKNSLKKAAGLLAW